MEKAFKLTASEDKKNGIVTLFRGQYPCICPFRAPMLVPIQSTKFEIGNKGQALEMVSQQCNSLCPHFSIINNTIKLYCSNQQPESLLIE